MTPNERIMIDELRSKGFSHADISEIHKEDHVQPLMADVILKWLPGIYKDHIGSGEHLIRALITTEKPFDPSAIIDLFENSEYNSTLKCTMAYVLAISKTHDITDYMLDQLLNKESRFERAEFLDCLTRKPRFQNNSELIGFLKRLFDKYFYFETF